MKDYRVLEADGTDIVVALDRDVNVDNFYERASEMAWNDVSELEYLFRKALERAGRTFNSKRITQEDIDAIEGEDFDYYSDLHGLMQREIERTSRTYIIDSLDDDGEDIQEDAPYITWDDINDDIAQDLTDSNASWDPNDLFGGSRSYQIGNSGDYYVLDYGVDTFDYKQPDQYDEVESEEEGAGAMAKEANFESNFRSEISKDQSTVVQKYIDLKNDFKKLRPDSKPFVDENGNVWYETEITPEDLDNPIIAFQKEGDKAKAAIDFMDEGRATVHIFKGADISSLAHEMTVT